MIYSETIEIVYSEILSIGVFSEEDPDYRDIDFEIRITEDDTRRLTMDDKIRIIE